MDAHVAMRITLKRFWTAVQTSGGFVQHNVTVFHGYIVWPKMVVLNVEVPRLVRHVVQMNDGADDVRVFSIVVIAQVASAQVFANAVRGGVCQRRFVFNPFCKNVLECFAQLV